MDKTKEQLGILIDLCEKQLRTIKVLSDFSLNDVHLAPQIEKINKAKKVFNDNLCQDFVDELTQTKR